MDTRTNNYSLSNTSGLSLFKDLVFLLMELTGESLGSLYDKFTLDAPQAVKKQIDNSVSDGHLGQIIKVIQDILREAKYKFNTPTTTTSTSTNTTSTNNNFNNTITKSFSSPNFYSTNCNSEENLSFSSTPNGSSIYSTPSNSTFLSSSPTKQPFVDSANSTPNGSNSPNNINDSGNLTADQIKIKQLELELLKIREAAAAMMNLKAANINNNTSSPSKSSPPPVSMPPPPPPPPPPVFKKPSPVNLKRGASTPNLSAGGSAQPPQFNISEILSKKPLLKKVNLDRSPGGTPSKERPKSGVEDVFKAILHKFKNENNHQSPCKGQTDDESSDSDFE